STNVDHATYYNRAKENLGIDSYGSGQIETLQAMILLGGYYLHYRNKPNIAYAVTGAAWRLACALGLHREFPERPPSLHEKDDSLPADTRRRTWWSLFILDTWGSTTMGRPSLSGHGPAFTVRTPGSVLVSFDFCFNV